MKRRVVLLGAVSLLAACRAGAPMLDPSPEEDQTVVAASIEPVVEAAELVVDSRLVRSQSVVADPAARSPEPFAGQTKVRVDELVAELDAIADQMAESPAVRADYQALLTAKGLADTPELFHDYVRVKLAFEATRDGGLWHLRWDITNEKPNSDQIWRQWAKAAPSEDETPVPTAVAECDELSALFAFVAGRLGVRHVGLFWPQWNHVVAVWTVQSEDGTPVRIIVPTSQIFLGEDESLGTEQFDPWTQKTIYEYRRKDVKDGHRIDAELARFFVVQARRHAGRSQAELQQLRNARDLAMSEVAE
ncbi:MAG: hypothetical protein H6712_09760 [Myxococcales bacterium]|nr:hypothetical protein [Myxococcales bacterium]MCB9714130.1 hypothetical protein [Myxococcales bacterium]